jgi:hypothetical protein
VSRTLALASLAFFAGCPPGSSQEDWQPVSYADAGDVCFSQAGSDVQITVTVSECMSSSCTRNFEGTCSATSTGSDVALTSDVHWEENVGAGTCTADCGIPMATCTLSGLADGTYTVTFGDQTFDLTVPATDDCGPL